MRCQHIILITLFALPLLVCSQENKKEDKSIKQILIEKDAFTLQGNAITISRHGHLLTSSFLAYRAQNIYIIRDGKKSRLQVIAQNPGAGIAILKEDKEYTDYFGIVARESKPITIMHRSGGLRSARVADLNCVDLKKLENMHPFAAMLHGRSKCVRIESDQDHESGIKFAINRNMSQLLTGYSGSVLMNNDGNPVGLLQNAYAHKHGNSFTVYASYSDFTYQTARIIHRTLKEGSYQPVHTGMLFKPGSLVVFDCLNDSPANKAGVRAGDRVIALNGRALKSSPEIGDILVDLNAGDQLELLVLRKQQKINIKITLAEYSMK